MIINQLRVILNFVILHMNQNNKRNPTSYYWSLFLLEPILKYTYIKFCLSFA
jgi:hypothetical protein